MSKRSIPLILRFHRPVVSLTWRRAFLFLYFFFVSEPFSRLCFCLNFNGLHNKKPASFRRAGSQQSNSVTNSLRKPGPLFVLSGIGKRSKISVQLLTNQTISRIGVHMIQLTTETEKLHGDMMVLPPTKGRCLHKSVTTYCHLNIFLWRPYPTL